MSITIQKASKQQKRIGFFEKHLTLWVALCIVGGILIGSFAADTMRFLSKMEIYRVNIPIAILIWLMIFPMMLQIDFSSFKNVRIQCDPQNCLKSMTFN